jgi:hypothetical protein
VSKHTNFERVESTLYNADASLPSYLPNDKNGRGESITSLLHCRYSAFSNRGDTRKDVVAGVMRSTMLFGNMQFWVSQFLKTVIPMYDIGSAIDIFCLCCQFEHSQKITPVLPIGFLKGLRVLT